jgi:hypothetical protein
VAVVKGRPKRFDSVAYYIRFIGPDGKQKFKSVGNDPALARTKQIEKQFDLDGRAAGIEVKVTDPATTEGTILLDSIAKYAQC